MPVAKITISIDSSLLRRVDELVRQEIFRDRSELIEAAVAEKISRLKKDRLAKECLKLSKTEERLFADSWLG
jgi:metal-responsive CopG/Arc/MetJ family transcriptional regulator